LGGLAHWRIKDLGIYQYQNFFSNSLQAVDFQGDLQDVGRLLLNLLAAVPDDLNSQWWAVSRFGGPAGYYYLEELIIDRKRSPLAQQPLSPEQEAELAVDYFKGEYNEGNFVRPALMRRDLSRPFDPEANPLAKFCESGPFRPGSRPAPAAMQPAPAGQDCPEGERASLLRRFAIEILPLAPAYGAAFAKFFYDIVNPPPYLVSVEARQGGSPLYRGHWQPLSTTRNTLHTNDFLSWKFDYRRALRLNRQNVTRAGFSEQFEPRAVQAGEDLTLVLTFSEPVRAPLSEDSGFSLSLQQEQGGSVPLPLSAASLQSAQDDRQWTVVVPSSALSTLQGFDGSARLLVTARDKNNHSDGAGDTRGSELDDDPRTPARRQRLNRTSDADFDYSNTAQDNWPWHDQQSVDPNYQTRLVNPIVVQDFEVASALGQTLGSLLKLDPRINGQTLAELAQHALTVAPLFSMQPGGFAYNTGQGDDNHLLFFGDAEVVYTEEEVLGPEALAERLAKLPQRLLDFGQDALSRARQLVEQELQRLVERIRNARTPEDIRALEDEVRALIEGGLQDQLRALAEELKVELRQLVSADIGIADPLAFVESLDDIEVAFGVSLQLLFDQLARRIQDELVRGLVARPGVAPLVLVLNKARIERAIDECDDVFDALGVPNAPPAGGGDGPPSNTPAAVDSAAVANIVHQLLLN
jgi:hypothetical protein